MRKFLSLFSIFVVVLSVCVVSASAAGVDLDIVDDPPSNVPFYGACYVTGTTSSGSTVTLFFPVNYKTGYFGVDDNGYLINISSTTINGYYSGGYNHSISLSRFDYPEYRKSGSSYDYTYLYIVPSASNIEIATEYKGLITLDNIMPFVYVLLLGVIILCCMKRS